MATKKKNVYNVYVNWTGDGTGNSTEVFLDNPYPVSLAKTIDVRVSDCIISSQTCSTAFNPMIVSSNIGIGNVTTTTRSISSPYTPNNTPLCFVPAEPIGNTVSYSTGSVTSVGGVVTRNTTYTTGTVTANTQYNANNAQNISVLLNAVTGDAGTVFPVACAPGGFITYTDDTATLVTRAIASRDSDTTLTIVNGTTLTIPGPFLINYGLGVVGVGTNFTSGMIGGTIAITTGAVSNTQTITAVTSTTVLTVDASFHTYHPALSTIVITYPPAYVAAFDSSMIGATISFTGGPSGIITGVNAAGTIVYISSLIANVTNSLYTISGIGKAIYKLDRGNKDDYLFTNISNFLGKNITFSAKSSSEFLANGNKIYLVLTIYYD